MSKPVASLSSSLLASKGRASAAGYEPPAESSIARLHAQLAAGRTAPQAVTPQAVTPQAVAPQIIPPQPVTPQAAPLLKVPRPTAKQPPAGDGKQRAAHGGGDGGRPAAATNVRLSYRMEPAQHRRFALLAAHLGKSKQQILNEALSDYLDQHGGRVAEGTCSCLGGSAHGCGPTRPLPGNGSE